MRVKIKSAKDVMWDALCRSADDKGRTDLTVSDLAALLVNRPGNQPTSGSIGAHATTHLLYSMQKGGLITFKVARVNTSMQNLIDIRLTQQGISECKKYRLAVKDIDHQYKGVDNESQNT